MKKQCNICADNLQNKNYCILKKPIINANVICYECIQKIPSEIRHSDIINIIINKPIIHLDKYNDDFSYYDYFLRSHNSKCL